MLSAVAMTGVPPAPTAPDAKDAGLTPVMCPHAGLTLVPDAYLTTVEAAMLGTMLEELRSQIYAMRFGLVLPVEAEIWVFPVAAVQAEVIVLDPRTVTSTPLIASPHVAATTQLPHVLIVPCHPAALWILVATPPVLRTLELNAALTTAEAAMLGSMLGGEK